MAPPQQIGQSLQYQQKWAFTVEIDSVVVAGFTKVGPLKQTQGLVSQEEGGRIEVVDETPSKVKTEKVTLERGASDNNELWVWWNNQRSGIPDKRNVTIVAQDPQGNPKTRYPLYLCNILEFEAGDFDGKNETENSVEKMVIKPLTMDKQPV